MSTIHTRAFVERGIPWKSIREYMHKISKYIKKVYTPIIIALLHFLRKYVHAHRY